MFIDPNVLGESILQALTLGVLLVGLFGLLIPVFPGLLVMWLATLLYALVMIFMRQLNRTEAPTAIVFYYLASSVALSGLTLPAVWKTPDLQGWMLFAALGLFGGLAQLLMTTAFRHADAALVAPFDYATVLWATLIGWLFWGEWPGPHLWLGGAIVVGSGFYLTHRESRWRLHRS